MNQVVELWDVRKGENSKARYRRIVQSFFDKFCFGVGCEVGDHDPIMPGVKKWTAQGEPDNTHDFVYSSVLHEQDDPGQAMKAWFAAVKPDGYLILYVPCRDLFEKKLSPPSSFNKSTKTFWLMEDCADTGTHNLLEVIRNNLAEFRIVKAELCDNGYGSFGHQLPSWGEYSYEVVIKKLRPMMPKAAYRLPDRRVDAVKDSSNWTLMHHGDRWHAIFRVDDNRIYDSNLHLDYPANGTNAKLVYATLDNQLNIVAKRPLVVTPDLSCEDPRLFVYRDRLWLAYNGAAYNPARFRQHIVSLQDGQPTNVFALERYRATDKNWMYFESEGNLYAVYSIDPHVVIRIDGDKIEEVARTEPNLTKKIWWYGEPRGGSCPWNIGNDEFLTFFQSHYIPYGFYRRVYVMGAYVFSAKPPFQIKRVTRAPLLVPETHDVKMHAVVFPGGAVFRDDKWVVPFGYNDCESGLAIFSREQVDSLMVPVS